MSAKPTRTRPTPGDPGSRLTAHVEPLLTAPAPPPSAPTTPAAATPPSEPTRPAASSPATTPPAANATPTTTEAEAPAVEVEQPTEPKPAAKRKTPRKTPTPADEPKGKRGPEVQFSTRIPEEVLAQSRAVVMFTAPYGGPRSLAELVESALIRENQRLAEEFNDGEPYKAFTGKFRTGRPLGS